MSIISSSSTSDLRPEITDHFQPHHSHSKEFIKLLSMGQWGILFAFIHGRAKGRPGCTLLLQSRNIINSSFQVKRVRNFVCANKVFGLDQFWLSRGDGRLENVKIIA